MGFLRSKAGRAASGVRDLRELLRPARRGLFVSGGVAVASALAGLTQPLIVRALLEDIDAGGSVGAGTVALLVLLFAIETVLWGVAIYVAGRAAAGLLCSLRVGLAARLMRLTIVEHDRARSDDLMSRLSNDTRVLGETVTRALMSIIPGTVLVFGSIVLMAVLDPLLFAVTFVAVAFSGGLLWWLSPKVQEASEGAQEAVSDLSVEAGRVLRPLRTVKAARAESTVVARVGLRADQARAESMRVTRLEALITPGTLMAFQGAYILILVLGGVRVASGELTVPDFVAFLLYLFTLTDPLQFTFEGVLELQKGLGAARRVKAVNEWELEDVEDARTPAAAPRDPVHVRFDSVSFEYRPGEPVLRDVTLAAQAGSLTAIVGESGSGKTTILALVERFYRPNAGRILLDGQDIEGMTLSDLRRRIGYVEQDAPLLDGSIRDNLLLGEPDAPQDVLDRAIAQSGLDAMLAHLPAGLDTQVGEAGVLLSGGQRQRVAIARALLSGPELLLLDEPTSQVDALTEAALRANLERLRGSRTVIVVAHRLATVVDADEIVLLERGHVIAVGTHARLFEHDPTYRALCQAQGLHAAVGAGPRE